MENKSKFEDLSKALNHSFKNAWEAMDEAETKVCFEFSEGYKAFLNAGKTERESAREIRKLAEAKGYKNIELYLSGKEKLVKGSKIYAVNRDKSIVLFLMGEKPLKEGMNIVGAHIDVPRLDLKPFPLYEDSDMAFFKTHYYGGIKKYQWTATPLALHGVAIDKNNNRIDIVIGEDEADPVFAITDLLPHLSKDQISKTLAEGIDGETLNVLVGHMPMGDDKTKDKIKLHILNILKEKYGLVEEDFLSAEFEIVPAGKAKDLGFDRSMISAYGHDDRVCSYTGMMALLDLENVETTAVGMFMDKEEVGSQGNTGSHSRFFENIVAELIAVQEENFTDLYLRRAISKTKVLSGDVGAAFDPNYAGAYEKRNSAYVGKGVQLVKYTGARGKGGCNDANAEFLGEVRNLFNANDIVWQIGELGKVDQGGGGTIAYILANSDAEVVDCGVPVLSMHAPYEIVSKVDVYMTYKAYKAFFNR
ncbi:aminopeptidase [Fusibacter tunisiensis]|uniref:M18 family aminopeptidase n=1 Tax=Fusibacter tunisiensis TaxID=1008308 RepID=A0ABS2MSM4_9FIRM|nr:aminopeptidase [Fusibacter tunisiensis]MBM7562402.1 aspartyl aminopeptidase [Fusibacter tunisiensis]